MESTPTTQQMMITNVYQKENTSTKIMAASQAASYLSESTCAGTPVELLTQEGGSSLCLDIFSMAQTTGKEGMEEETKMSPVQRKQLLRKVQSAAAPTDSTFLIAASKLMVPRPRPVALETRQTKLTEYFNKNGKSKTTTK
jgi:hypothetical protein